MKKLALLFLNLLLVLILHAEDGYSLWLRYQMVGNAQLLAHYRSTIKGISFVGGSPTLSVAKKACSSPMPRIMDRKQ